MDQSFVKIFRFLCFFLMFACNQTINEPKNLLSQEVIANIIAEISLSENILFVDTNFDTKASFKLTMKKYNCNTDTFKESYTYYLSRPELLNDILSEAKQIILEKEPSLSKELEKQVKINLKTQ